MNKYLTEFIGTFFLILVIGLTGNPLAIGAVLMVMVFMGGHVSGGHYNPAVSLAILMRGKMEAKEMIIYWVFQILGALVAAFVCFIFTDKTIQVMPAAGLDAWKAVLAEILGTFALVSVVLNVATSKGTEGNSFYGLAIGFTVLAFAFAFGPISGGAFNPAVAIGPIIVDTIKGGTTMGTIWIYLVGCFGGGALGAIVYRMTNPGEFHS